MLCDFSTRDPVKAALEPGLHRCEVGEEHREDAFPAADVDHGNHKSLHRRYAVGGTIFLYFIKKPPLTGGRHLKLGDKAPQARERLVGCSEPIDFDTSPFWAYRLNMFAWQFDGLFAFPSVSPLGPDQQKRCGLAVRRL